jgi:ABC-type branched-subunit amino acid transport system substrate-binding protein
VNKKSRDRIGARVGVFVAVGALVLAACGSSSKSSSSSSTTATTASSTSSAPASSATSGGGGGGGSTTICGPGVSPSTIKIGQIATVSGPVPGLFQNAADSMDAFVAYINSQGGVDGHQLAVVHKDDGYDCVTYTNAMKSLSTSVFAIVGTFSVEDGCGASVLKANPSFPDLEGYVLNPTLLSLPNVFASEVQPPGFFTTGYQYVKDKFPADIARTGAIYPTSAVFEYKEQTAAAKSIGFNYVYTRGIGATETNFTSDILRMKAAGVKFVDLESDPVNVIASFVQEATQQGFHPDVIFGSAAYDSAFFKLLGSGPAAAVNNIIAPLQWVMYLGEDRATTPELNTYLTWLDKVHPGDTANVFGISAWSAGVQFIQALKAAGSNVTQSGLIQATANLGNFNANGLTPGSDPGKRIGPHCVIIAGTRNGKFVRLDPPTSGFECNGTYLNVPLSQLG